MSHNPHETFVVSVLYIIQNDNNLRVPLRSSRLCGEKTVIGRPTLTTDHHFRHRTDAPRTYFCYKMFRSEQEVSHVRNT